MAWIYIQGWLTSSGICSFWFWLPFYLAARTTHKHIYYIRICWISCVFSFFCLKFQWHNKCVVSMSVRWLLYFALRSIESMNKNQTAVCSIIYRCEGTHNVLSIWIGAKWYKWQKVAYQDLAFILHIQLMYIYEHLRGQNGIGWDTRQTFKRCLIFVQHSANRKFVYFLSKHSENSLKPHSM